MIDRDLAELYGVETKVLNQAVKRNRKRFPEDFMFQLTKQEAEIWKSQIVISNSTESLRSQFVTLEKGRDGIQSIRRMFSQSRVWLCFPAC